MEVLYSPMELSNNSIHTPCSDPHLSFDVVPREMTLSVEDADTSWPDKEPEMTLTENMDYSFGLSFQRVPPCTSTSGCHSSKGCKSYPEAKN